MKTVLITGYKGFIGRNLIDSLTQRNDFEILKFGKEDKFELLTEYLNKADYLFHLAGVNRPQNETDFNLWNAHFTKKIVDYLIANNLKTKIIFSSSTQALLDNSYGRSKLMAEEEILRYSRHSKSEVFIYRLPNLFGKYAKPNYNSVVATFLYNISHDLDIKISEPNKVLSLVYIDDVIQEFTNILDGKVISDNGYCKIDKIYKITLMDLSKCIYDIRDNKHSDFSIYKVLFEAYKFYKRSL